MKRKVNPFFAAVDRAFSEVIEGRSIQVRKKEIFDIDVFVPCKGIVVRLHQLKGTIFRSGITGTGFGVVSSFMPSVIYSPISGTLTRVFGDGRYGWLELRSEKNKIKCLICLVGSGAARILDSNLISLSQLIGNRVSAGDRIGKILLKESSSQGKKKKNYKFQTGVFFSPYLSSEVQGFGISISEDWYGKDCDEVVKIGVIKTIV